MTALTIITLMGLDSPEREMVLLRRRWAMETVSAPLLLEQSQRPTWLLGFHDGADGWNRQLGASAPFRCEGRSQGSGGQRVSRQRVQQGPSEHIWDQVADQLQRGLLLQRGLRVSCSDQQHKVQTRGRMSVPTTVVLQVPALESGIAAGDDLLQGRGGPCERSRPSAPGTGLKVPDLSPSADGWGRGCLCSRPNTSNTRG